ncbi:tetratricopeptide repeat protein [Bizionia sediminis]|uniref:Tetratricopeptide repeat protein n=1 Tax=Bizionia sediminis TaxID=1737064 RepID=A0ABW5KTW8_9FLAO
MKKICFCLFLPLITWAQNTTEQVTLLLEKKDYKAANELIVPYVKNNPDNLKALELLGDTYSFQTNWDAAIEAYKKLTILDNTQANFFYKYGGAMGMKALDANKVNALLLIDDIKEAFLKAAELDPKHIDVRWALVELYIQLPGILGGSVKKALVYASELENISKVDGYLAKGTIYESDKNFNLAESYYKKAVAIGGSITCYDALSEFYDKQKQPEKAIETIEISNKKHPRNAVNYQIGKVAATYNIQLEKGINCLKKYLANYSVTDGVPKAWAYYRLAQIYKHQKQKQEALKYINMAVAALPDIAEFKKERQLVLKL